MANLRNPPEHSPENPLVHSCFCAPSRFDLFYEVNLLPFSLNKAEPPACSAATCSLWSGECPCPDGKRTQAYCDGDYAGEKIGTRRLKPTRPIAQWPAAARRVTLAVLGAWERVAPAAGGKLGSFQHPSRR